MAGGRGTYNAQAVGPLACSNQESEKEGRKEQFTRALRHGSNNAKKWRATEVQAAMVLVFLL